MEYVGEVVNPKDFRKRAKEYSKDKNRHYYFMALKSDQIIDATNKGNISRFINHSCDPNAETQKVSCIEKFYNFIIIYKTINNDNHLLNIFPTIITNFLFFFVY